MTARSKALGALAVALCASLALWMWNAERARWTAEVDRLRAANLELEGKLTALQPAHPAPTHTQTAPHIAPAPKPSDPRASASTADAARAELIRMLEDRRQKLAAAQQALADSQNQNSELTARLEQLTVENQNLAKAETELKDRVDNQVRLAAALQTQLKEKAERAVELELSNRELRRRVEENAARVSQLSRTAREIDDLSRRREVYLNGILRRYREVTDLFRGATMRADSPGADQTRIQNAINMADEDLKQLQALNAQAARLQRALADAK
jgi:DNA repair exonuclease SbcCD ATPase subunit